ncbi:MAG: DUF58 domain-containing protein [Chloroflexota bacterium]
MNPSENASLNEKENGFSSPATGFLFSRFSLLVVLAGLVLAAWYGQLVLVILLALLLSAAGLSWLWSKSALSGVTCQRQLSEHRLFPGEQTELRLGLANRKLLPLPWIQIDDEIPLPLSTEDALTPGIRPGYGLLSRAAALLWYSAVNWKLRLTASRRGYYPVGPLTVTSGDIFGFYPRSRTVPLNEVVIVYPQLFPVAQFGIPSRHPLGETVTERRLFEDPLRVIGVRDYHPEDSRRRIHWKASARRQELQVKTFEPTTTLKVVLFFAVDSFRARQGEEYNKNDFELGISAAASIAQHLITDKREAAGLFVNSRLADSGQPARLAPGSSSRQLVEILEDLAKVTIMVSHPMDEFLEAVRGSLPWGSTLVFILSSLSAELRNALLGLREAGQQVLVLQVGGRKRDGLTETIPWLKIKEPADFRKVSVGQS